MQYDLDMKGEFSDIFKKIRDILLSYPEIKELKNAKQTSYSDKYGVIIMMRPKGKHYVLAFGKGYKLADKYPVLGGSGKIVRHLYFKSADEVDEQLIRELIEESFVLGMEAYELKKLRCSLKVNYLKS
ncbi:MAG: Unknown protein [uncultured Sulfurovum sp.]|uniref:YdhG-like domain-containing protein n=1 Tax=uncultured Sulfurovum sp. TaxID=269237 RepID=A0A6S6S9X9_9BACT|nr:MAG: Unknown protein [uncultured Sulfurovum sp.]